MATHALARGPTLRDTIVSTALLDGSSTARGASPLPSLLWEHTTIGLRTIVSSLPTYGFAPSSFLFCLLFLSSSFWPLPLP